MKTKKTFIFIIAIIIFLSFTGFAQAAQRGRPLEIDYPDIPGPDIIPQETTTPVPEYVQYIYYFLLGISGVIALGVLIYAGFQYFTSAGSPEKINEAKDRIGAALLGLLILFGSYLILYNINPDLVSFNLPRLRPIIPALPSGVLLCKKDVPVMEAWQLTREYYTEPGIDREREIREELKVLLEEIALHCYTVRNSSDIRSDFDNKVKIVWFIPYIWIKKENDKLYEYETEYGAIFYEERKLEGKSQAYYDHLISTAGGWKPYRRTVNLQASSIIPFQLIYDPDPTWEVILYEKVKYNEEVAEGHKKTLPPNAPPGYRLPANHWYRGEGSTYNAAMGSTTPSFPWSPESMKMEGDLLVVLFGKLGGSQAFFNKDVSDLEAYYNIVEMVDCDEYEIVCGAGGMGGGGCAKVPKPCAEAATIGFVMISATSL